MPELARLADRLARYDESRFDAALADAVRRRVFDTLAASGVGLATPEGETLLQLHRSLGPPAEGGSVGVDQRDLCRLLAGAARATEIDDIDVQSCTTVGCVAVPVALACAARTRHEHSEAAAGRRLLQAVNAGYEAMQRLGRSIGGATLIYRGVWPTHVTAAFAAAAVVGVHARVDAATLANALGLALQSVAPLTRTALARPGFRQFAVGEAASAGWHAAQAAMAGLRPAENAFNEFVALLDRTAGSVEVETRALTDQSVTATAATVDAKTFPTSRQALASIAAFRQLMPLVLDDVQAITVRVPAPYLSMVDQPAMPTSRIASMIGVQYAMALVAVGSDSLFDVSRSRLPSSDVIDAWMARIRVEADPALTTQFPAVWGSRVEVVLGSGKRIAAEELMPMGSASAPLGWEALRAKYARIAAAQGLQDSRGFDALADACLRCGDDDEQAIASSLLQQAHSLGATLRDAARERG